MAVEEAEQAGIEKQIERAICSRVQHFKDQADSLTLESVRRLLEKDLGLEKFALDAYKRFVRQYLEKKMDDADDYKSKIETENVDKDVHSIKEETTSPKPHEMKNNLKKSSTGDEEMMEDSPIMGVLTPKSEPDKQGSSVSESKIKKAIWDRADHFLANSENITLAGVRRLLEEDLELAKSTLDPFKKCISQEIDQVLNHPKGVKSAKDGKKKTSDNSKSKKPKEVSREESGSSGSESDEIEDKIKPKEATSRRKVKTLEQTKKRKISESDLDTSRKESKTAKRQKEEDNDSDADESLSEDGQSPSSVEKPAKKKEKPAPGYGKQVEHLKSIIKACGMSVTPLIYKKAKQVPESNREAFLVKELEAILSREGLPKNPSVKDIKNCRKKKETARELEGIDMSNIISSSRRRSTFSFVSPVKPEVYTKKYKAGAKVSNAKDISDNEEEKEVDKKDEEEEKKEEEEKEVDKKDEKEEKEEVEKKEKGKEETEGEGGDEEEEVEEDNEDDGAEDDDDEEEEEEEEESEEFNEDDNEDSD